MTMTSLPGHRFATRVLARLLAAALALGCGAAAQAATAVAAVPEPARDAAADTTGGAAALRARHAQLAGELAHNSFQRALHVASAATPQRLQGDVDAVLDHPFAMVSDALADPLRWCDMLILPFNVKYCRAVGDAGAPRLQMRIGRKHDQPLATAYRMEFTLRNVARGGDYFESRLTTAEGPLGTHDYRFVLSATPLDARRTFMHLSYSYGYGTAGRLAMQTYLATVGAGKVGFTVTERDASGQPVYVDGMRGAVERNAMRYYLAVDAYLDTLAEPVATRLDRRIRAWFAATERYPRQLHEMDGPAYLAMKRAEQDRQQAMID